MSKVQYALFGNCFRLLLLDLRNPAWHRSPFLSSFVEGALRASSSTRFAWVGHVATDLAQSV